MKIAVLGAFGQMAEACLFDLCRSSSVTSILAADLSLARSKIVLSRLPNRRKVRAVQLDMTSPAARRKLAGSDVVVNCAWYELNLKGMDLALALKAHYVDLGGLYHMTLKQLRRSEEFRRARLTAVLGCGSTPGITNMMAEKLVRDMDRVESLHVYDISQEPAAAKGSFLPPFSIRTMLDEYEMKAPVLRNGRMVELPAYTDKEELSFAPPFGRAVAGAVIHSELASLPEAYRSKGLKHCSFKIVYPESVLQQLDLLVGMGFSRTDAVAVNGSSVSPRNFLTALALKGMAESSASETPKDLEVLRVLAEGTMDGVPVAQTLDCTIRYGHGLAAGAMGVGFPASIAAQMAAGGALQAGATAPEGVLPVVPFFRELDRRKVFRFDYSLKRPAKIP